MTIHDATKLGQIRAQLPVTQRVAFLNTGSSGPLPTVAADVMSEAARRELEGGRANVGDYFVFHEKVQETRAALARLFNAPLDAIALTHHTTEGMNIVTWGLEWQPGDEIVTTTLEHEGGLYPLYIVRARRGAVLRFADVGLGQDPLPAIERVFTPRTRLLALSHVSYSSGARFPLNEIIEFAHSRGVMVAVDGAQSAGAFEINLTALDVDFYAIPGQKWLCGPEGTGALYVRPDRLADLHPTFVGYGSFERQDWQGHFIPMPGAARFHTATVYRPGILGQMAALRWFEETVGPKWAYQRIAYLASLCRELLEGLDGVQIITPSQRQAGLVNFRPTGWSPLRLAALSQAAIERGYLIRPIPHAPYCLRVSAGFYNTDAELVGLRDALGELLDAGPDAVEIPEYARALGLSDEPLP